MWQNKEMRDKIVKRIFEASHLRPNYQEQEVNNLLQEILPKEYKYVGDGTVIIEGKCPDFINVNGQKKIIEFFGKRWHPKEHEKIRIKYFKKYGYKTLIIWDKELKNIEKLKKRILQFNSK